MQVSLDDIKKTIDELLDGISGHPMGHTSSYLDGYLSGLRDGNAITHEDARAARNRMIEILRNLAAYERDSRAV